MSTAAQTDATEKKKKGSGVMAVMQRIGRSLMLPVAVMPAAALLVRLGNTDMLGRESFPTVVTKIAGYMSAGGGAIINNIALLFCVGVAIGMAKKADGSTALAAVAGFLVYYGVLPVPDCTRRRRRRSRTARRSPRVPEPRGVRRHRDGPAHRVSGSASTARSWWTGSASSTAAVSCRSSWPGSRLFSVVFACVWPPIGDALTTSASGWWTWARRVGHFRCRQPRAAPVGMHQFLNTFIWFQFGDFTKPDGTIVHGDIPRFLAGDPTAGQFQTGFFPIMMFALPAAALAIAHCASRTAARRSPA